MPTENDKEPVQRPTVMLPRLGNVQALVEMRGEGIYKQPYVRFNKILTKGTPLEHQFLYSVEEVAALRQLCDNILTDIYRAQTLVIPGGSTIPTPKPDQAVEKEGA